jgi:RecB family exonuclease
VLERMRATDRFGPRTLEEYARCPYRWFVDHELKPQGVEPEGDALTAGGIAHEVLERLYAEQPGGEPRPTPATLADWRRRAHELIQELGPEGLPRERADTSAELSRVEGLVLAFLGDEAAAEVPFLPAPELAEASFGFEDSEKPELRLATGGVHGRIDRIDIGPAGEALVQDYKLSSKVDGGRGMLDRGKLQLQLYLLAARELWGLDLAGGLYRPLAATSKRQPKGILRQEAKADLAGLDTRRDDHLDDAEFEATLADAAGRAEEIMEAIHAGEIGRRPLGGKCPEWCDFQPICRRERGLPEEEPEAESADEGEG